MLGLPVNGMLDGDIRLRHLTGNSLTTRLVSTVTFWAATDSGNIAASIRIRVDCLDAHDAG